MKKPDAHHDGHGSHAPNLTAFPLPQAATKVSDYSGWARSHCKAIRIHDIGPDIALAREHGKPFQPTNQNGLLTHI